MILFGKSKKIKEILFPKIKKVKEQKNVYYLDESVDMNIIACIQDIRNGHKDAVLIETLKDIQRRLEEVKRILGVEDSKIKESGNYIVRPKSIS
jgi:hypothetical protein